MSADGYQATMRVAREQRAEYVDVIGKCLQLAGSSPAGTFSGHHVGVNCQNLARWGVIEKLPRDEQQRRDRRSTTWYRVPDAPGVQRAMKELGKRP